MLRNYRLRDYDFKLILFILATSAIGVLAIGSAKESLQNKQLAGVILGVVIMTVISLIDYHWILKFYWLMYAGNLVLLGAVILTSAETMRAVPKDGGNSAVYGSSRPKLPKLY
mgnify:CR=1 FL=1